MEYLRALYYPLKEGGFHFPVLTLKQIEMLGDEHWRRVLIELGREICTLIMLATLGIVSGRNRREAWSYSMVAFGVWDIFFYGWLKLFLDWPSSLLTWDLLFLIPIPWVGPVLAPVLISLAMIVTGITVLYLESQGRPVIARWIDWLLIVLGGVVVIVSFCWDYKNIMNGGSPAPFQWPLFLAGLSTGCVTFAAVLWRRPS